MRRRSLLPAPTLMPEGARAQPKRPAPVVGFVALGSAEISRPGLRAFRAGLAASELLQAARRHHRIPPCVRRGGRVTRPLVPPLDPIGRAEEVVA